MGEPSHDVGPAWLEQSYDRFPRVEEEFHAALDESLAPRGPDVLYDLVADLRLPPGAAVLDVGCGEGAHALALAGRFGLAVTAVDPVPRHIEIARGALSAAGALAGSVRFELGSAESLPAGDGTVDLVWCRDVLLHVADLETACAEFARVLRSGGRALVYQMFAGALLEAGEAAWLWQTMGVVPGNADPARTTAAAVAAGLVLDRRVDLGTEWGEWAEETSGKPGRRLLYAARLLREPERYVARFGRPAYDLMLGDCLWHVYGMIGKLDRKVLLLSKP